MKKLMSVFLIMVLLATSTKLLPVAYAEDDKWGEISVNDEFSDDRIIVIMENDVEKHQPPYRKLLCICRLITMKNI